MTELATDDKKVRTEDRKSDREEKSGKAINLTIDGKMVRAEKGNTILQAAFSHGIKIPNLCYDKRIVPFGGCRICVVEIEGQRKLEASCATLALEGMVVRTDTPKVIKARQAVLEFMAVHHPLDCPVCDKAGECDLQDLIYKYGKPQSRFVRERKHTPSDVRSPLIELNSQRCILCAKCVRICAEHQGRGALGLIGRGFPTVVQPAFGEVLECDNCGQCIDICPTGALLSKPYKFKARPWFLEEKETTCPFCSCGCTLTLGIMEGRILRSRGKEDSGVSEGNLCGRGRFGIDYIYSENRLETPLIKKAGAFVPVSWEEAFNYISDNLKYIINFNGPSFAGAIGSPRCTNEDNFILQKFMREVVGSNNIDSAAAFGYGLVEKAWKMAFGRSGHKINLKSPLGKEVILVIESDPGVTHPFFGLNILHAKKNGSKLIVADSRETKLTQKSSQWTKIKQGTGVVLLNGIIKILIDRKLFDNENASKVSGFSDLEKSLKDFTPEKVSRIAGTTEEELITIAETLVNAKARMLCLSVGAAENSKGLDTLLAAANLINLLGESPDALQIPAECSNTFGLYQMGVRPDAGFGYKPLARAGKGLSEMLYESGSINALYIMGADPAVSLPHTSKILRALKSLDLLVVQDMALTETAKLAHVVLPASGWAEKDGNFTNAEGITQRTCKVIASTGQSLPDWQIINNLALAMGKDMGIRDRDDILKEINSLSAVSSDPVLTTRVFNPAGYLPAEEADSEYPLNLVVRDVLQHAGSMTTRSKSLNLVVSEAILEINENDAEKLGIADKSHVKVTSRRGTARLKAAVTEGVPDGIVYVPAHFPHSGVGILTCPPASGRIPVDAVRVEAI